MLRKLFQDKQFNRIQKICERECKVEHDQFLLDCKIAEANKLIEEYKKKLEEPNRSFTVLETFDISGECFLGQLHEIANNKAFLFHMHALKTDCLNSIIDGDAKTAIVRQGMLKGIDKVLHSLNVASKQYKELTERKEYEQQIQP